MQLSPAVAKAMRRFKLALARRRMRERDLEPATTPDLHTDEQCSRPFVWDEIEPHPRADQWKADRT